MKEKFERPLSAVVFSPTLSRFFFLPPPRIRSSFFPVRVHTFAPVRRTMVVIEMTRTSKIYEFLVLRVLERVYNDPVFPLVARRILVIRSRINRDVIIQLIIRWYNSGPRNSIP